jgi:imidazolonepropionase-like amidohydrolase
MMQHFNSLKGTLLLFILMISGYSLSQIPHNGVAPSKAPYYALTNATIFVSPTETLDNATILIKGTTIEKVGKRVSLPKNAVEIDCKGLTILPSFIELSTDIGVKKAIAGKSNGRPQMESSKSGSYYWNESIHPEVDASEGYTPNEKANKSYLDAGFGFAFTHQKDGVAQGQGSLVTLTKSKLYKPTLNMGAGSFFSFSKGVSRQSYPSSQMGSIALLRQAFYDAKWYKTTEQTERNLSLEALNNQWDQTSIFYTKDKWEILRAAKIAKEFDRSFAYVGSGDEYGIVEELKGLSSTIILPINFPKAYDVTDPYVARQIPLSDLKQWEMAPYNASILVENGIPICITMEGHKTAKDFWAHLRKAIEHGLSKSDALAALTMNPAKLIGADSKIGSLEAGKLASFTIYSSNPLEDASTEMIEAWSLGERNIVKVFEQPDLAGKYSLLVDERRFPLKIESKGSGKFSGSIAKDGGDEKDSKINVTVIVEQNDITLQFGINDSVWKGSVNLKGKVNHRLHIFEGDGMIPTGEWVKWHAVQKEKGKSEKPKEDTPFVADTSAVAWFPNMAYGFDSIPEAESILFSNVTIWTNGIEGIIKKGFVLVKDGKIDYAGMRKPAIRRGTIEIDGTGKHLTSGIIDEHSHIAISKGVNESGQAITAEVSIGDVVHPDDINIYRQLSGGVTAAQLLHGSANPVGGQSALVKLKWGHTPEEMLIDNAPGFIKFALGENVKQSNWGSYNTVRFPQTRMGVEQVYYDGFARARAYEEEKKTNPNYRVDLELEVLSEILNSTRFISCHSYVQSEINMLMHVADSMGFRINTFTHILEGYKVADKMAKHGAGGSTFSDWWAYKYEVNDAIPYNAKMMHDQGVVVAINSDDAEMGRRLNQEAAKAVKYGGMDQEDAWKMVTLNPAKLLHLDDRMGSVEVGKDADLVLWTANPLSIMAKVEYTVIDGVILYDASRASELYERNQAEKARIIAKMLNANAAGDKTEFVKKKKGHYHCNTIGQEGSHGENHH